MNQELQPNGQNEISEEKNNAPAAKDQGFRLLDLFEMIGFALLATLLVFSFAIRTCRVDGNSMNNTLRTKELVLASPLFYEPAQGDVVVFHLVNESYKQPLVKRVIALEGQKVKIDLTAKEVYVDGVRLDEPYVYLENDYYNPSGYFDYHRLYTDPNGHLVFMTEVPEGCLFVMGDNRNHSTDSRTTAVGFVDENCIIGKVFLRVKPFSVIE